MNRRAAHAFLVAAVASPLIWVLSPLLTGHAEPWDADGPDYIVALLIAGMVSGAMVPRSLWAHYVGAVVGQLVFELLFLNVGPLFLLGIVFLLGFSAIFLAAAAGAAYARNRFCAWYDET